MAAISPQYAKWFVYYNDEDYGFESFETQDAALAFITTRLAIHESADHDKCLMHYKLFYGSELKIGAVERITKIAIVG